MFPKFMVHLVNKVLLKQCLFHWPAPCVWYHMQLQGYCFILFTPDGPCLCILMLSVYYFPGPRPTTRFYSVATMAFPALRVKVPEDHEVPKDHGIRA